jgi:hypothetical protein
MTDLTDKQRERAKEIAISAWNSALVVYPGHIERAIIQALKEIGAEMVEQERGACAKVADSSSKEANRIGLLHPENSDSRGRMFARAMEATYIGRDIRSRSKQEPSA